jgi:hypothetical protein
MTTTSFTAAVRQRPHKKAKGETTQGNGDEDHGLKVALATLGLGGSIIEEATCHHV